MSESDNSGAPREFDPVALLAVAATVLVWGGSYTGIRIALTELTPVQIAVLRYAAAAILAAVFLVSVRRRLPSRGAFFRLVVVGVFYVLGFAVLLNAGQQTVTAGTASFIVGTSPVMIAITAVVVLGERFGRISWFGAMISFLGVVVIAFGSGDRFSLEFGVVLVLGAAFAASAASIIQKPLLADLPPVALTAWILMLGVVPLLPVLPGAAAALTLAAPEVVWAVAFLAVFSTIIGYIGWSVALKRMPAGRAGSFLNGVPLAATAIGYLYLGEVPTTAELVGGLLALSGVIIVNAARGR